MSYSEIDSTISNWVDRYGFTLFNSYEDMTSDEFRAVYISSDSECCQISIDKPNSGKVCIHAADIETIGDRELDKTWCVSISELQETLENAVTFVRNWFEQKHT